MKLGIPYTVRIDGGSEFQGPFQELLKEFGIPYTPSSPYNLECNGMVECFVGIMKLLLKKTLDPKEDFKEELSYLNNSTRLDGFSPAELFYKRTPHSFLSDIIQDINIEEGMRNNHKQHIHM